MPEPPARREPPATREPGDRPGIRPGEVPGEMPGEGPGGGSGLRSSGRPERSARLRAVVLLVVSLAVVVTVWATPVREVLATDIDSARARLESTGAWGPLLFTLVCAAAVAVGVPRLWFAALGGLAFGWLVGALLAQLGTIAGAWLTYRASRSLGREYVRRRLGRRAARLERFLDLIGEHGIVANVLLRSAPVGNCFAMNLFMGVSPIRTRDFLIGTFLGTAPETVIYALFGSSAAKDPALRIVSGLALLALLALAVSLAFRRWKRGVIQDRLSA